MDTFDTIVILYNCARNYTTAFMRGAVKMDVPQLDYYTQKIDIRYKIVPFYRVQKLAF